MYPTKRAAYFNLSPTLLKYALHIPEETRLLGVDWEFMNDCIRVYIEHPELQEVLEGGVLPLISPTVTKEIVEDITHDHVHDFKYTWKFNQEPK